MNTPDNDLAARLEADIAAHGRPPASAAGIALTVANVKAALGTDDPSDLPHPELPEADNDFFEANDLLIVPCACRRPHCPECGPQLQLPATAAEQQVSALRAWAALTLRGSPIPCQCWPVGSGTCLRCQIGRIVADLWK